MNLTETLHDSFLSSGEIHTADTIAEIVQRYEFDHATTLDARAVLTAVREAGEQFVDSMVENERDTHHVEGAITEDEMNERVKQWEAMRPSVIRKAELVKMLEAAPIEEVSAPANPTKEFVTELVSETAYGSTSMGKHHNKMELHREGFRGSIIWNYGQQAADEDETVIGLIFEGMSVTDYDGVFSLPREARMLLIEAGYNLEAVWYDQKGDEIHV